MWMIRNKVVSFSRVDWLCANLAKQIEKENFDLIVSIENGGWYVGQVLSFRLGLPHKQVTIRRYDDVKMDSIYKSFHWSLRFIPLIFQWFIHHFKPPKVLEGLDEPMSIKGKKVLLVDDSIDTGSTMDLADLYIDYLGAREVKRVALSCVKDPINPALYIMKGRYVYPWSKISPEYEKFRKMHKLNRSEKEKRIQLLA